MSALRLVIVTPRYWPLVGESERTIAGLAEGFLRQGARPTILTAAWDTDWPKQVVHREVPVERLPNAPTGGWNTFRYLRSLSRWLRRHSSDFDAAYVVHLRNEAYTVIGASDRRRFTIVLRSETGGVLSDARWQLNARFGKRIAKRCELADAIVTPTGEIKDDLVRHGYAAEKVTIIPDAAMVVAERSDAHRHHARAALAAANRDLQASDYAPVALSVGRMDEHAGLMNLIRAWRGVAERLPSAQLWLIGDGPARAELYDHIVDHGLQHQLRMPGSFDNTVELMQAADIYVAPGSQPGATISMLESMASGLPLVAIDTVEHREVIRHETNGLLVPDSDPLELSAAICTLFERPDLAFRLGASGRQIASDRYSPSRAVMEHLSLFQRLSATKTGGAL